MREREIDRRSGGGSGGRAGEQDRRHQEDVREGEDGEGARQHAWLVIHYSCS